MTSPFDGFEVERQLRPSAQGLGFDLDRALSSVVVLHARVPPDAFTAVNDHPQITTRLGNGDEGAELVDIEQNGHAFLPVTTGDGRSCGLRLQSEIPHRDR